MVPLEVPQSRLDLLQLVFEAAPRLDTALLAASPPRGSCESSEPRTEKEQRRGCGHVPAFGGGKVGSDLELVLVKSVGRESHCLKGASLDDTRKDGHSRRQSNGGGIGRELHVEEKTARRVSDQESITERSSHSFQKILGLSLGSWGR